MHTKAQWVAFFVNVLPVLLFGQEIADSSEKSIWKISAYAETYLSIDRRLQKGQKISDFQFNHNRINRVELNQGLLGVDYLAKNIRANFALHAGTYVKDNYGAEPVQLQSINKAFAGFRIDKKKNIWLDAGVFPSYIGFESVNAFDNTTLTRSLLAENSPYFLTGARVNYPVNPKNELSIYVLTGWQRIVPQKNNSIPSFGWQWVHAFQNQDKFNWSFWAGTDYPDSTRRWRYFNNFYWQGKKGKWAYTVGLDIGLEQKEKKSTAFSVWHSPVLITQFSISDKWRSSFRMERYADPQKVIAKPTNGSVVMANSQSINLDFLPIPSILCRIEWRALQSKEPVFYRRNDYFKQANFITFSITYLLNKTVSKNNN